MITGGALHLSPETPAGRITVDTWQSTSPALPPVMAMVVLDDLQLTMSAEHAAALRDALTAALTEQPR